MTLSSPRCRRGHGDRQERVGSAILTSATVTRGTPADVPLAASPYPLQSPARAPFSVVMRSGRMVLAKIRVCDVVVASFATSCVDADVGRDVLELVRATLAEGARSLVLDFGAASAIEAAGALAIGAASRALAARGGQLILSGLGPRARATVRALFAGPAIALADAWTDAVELAAAPALRRAA